MKTDRFRGILSLHRSRDIKVALGATFGSLMSYRTNNGEFVVRYRNRYLSDKDFSTLLPI